MDYFEEALSGLLAVEGGYVDDPADRGGETRFGITAAVARAFGYAGPMRELPLRTAGNIYRRKYWDAVSLDAVAGWDQGNARRLFDIAVNMGPRTAGKFLQRSLNLLNRGQQLFPDLRVDGLVGAITIQALERLDRRRDAPLLLKLLAAYQGRRYIEIIENDPLQERFTRGWLKRLGS
ncbi:MAG: hypothetical protein OEZ59_04560 [Deltaproteobacteria bacterium]|nr:hypothetical protein [Deltaproteobacteria bacterium]